MNDKDIILGTKLSFLPTPYSPWSEPVFREHVIHEEVEQGYYANLWAEETSKTRTEDIEFTLVLTM